jgi:hypothetical protein
VPFWGSVKGGVFLRKTPFGMSVSVNSNSGSAVALVEVRLVLIGEVGLVGREFVDRENGVAWAD